MLELITPYISIIAIVIATFAILLLFIKFQKVNRLLQQLSLQYEELVQTVDTNERLSKTALQQLTTLVQHQSEESKEVNEVSRHLEHRIAQLQRSLDEQKQVVEGIQHQEPQDKLYSRAQKMVSLGADVEEIMSECELPRAEAEMLVAMHRRNKP
ncbi:DUF2802 domain-containing protein [Thalassotalea fusca]